MISISMSQGSLNVPFKSCNLLVVSIETATFGEPKKGNGGKPVVGSQPQILHTGHRLNLQPPVRPWAESVKQHRIR